MTNHALARARSPRPNPEGEGVFQQPAKALINAHSPEVRVVTMRAFRRYHYNGRQTERGAVLL